MNKIISTLPILLVLLLGGCEGGSEKSPEPVVLDADNDGIPDETDQCPDTASEFNKEVNQQGCDTGEMVIEHAMINVGGINFNTVYDVSYISDSNFQGGWVKSSSNQIALTHNDELYQSARLGVFSYSIPAREGNYEITLHFADLDNAEAGQRIFDIEIESQVVLAGLDIAATVGQFSAHEEIFEQISVTDGSLDISFNAIASVPILSAISITQTFGRSLDEDNDGVKNFFDACMFTRSEFAADVNESGCSDSEADMDNDLVLDKDDQCLDTPMGELIISNGCSASQLDFDNDGVMNDLDVCDYTDSADIGSIDSDGCSASEQNYKDKAFIEEDGLIVVDLASTIYPDGWKLKTGNYSISNKYLAWEGSDNFNTPGQGTITFLVDINNPGTYRFEWTNIVGAGSDPTEHNDSWLKIHSDNFFGDKQGHIVCPRAPAVTNRCNGHDPEGSSSSGWFKVYRSGPPVDQWKWAAYTSDNDAHPIFATFDNQGKYMVQVSGRSKHHAIDRIVMYRSKNDSNNVSESFAKSKERMESKR